MYYVIKKHATRMTMNKSMIQELILKLAKMSLFTRYSRHLRALSFGCYFRRLIGSASSVGTLRGSGTDLSGGSGESNHDQSLGQRTERRHSLPEELFISLPVQQILHRLTGRSLERVFGRQPVDRIRTSDIKLLTEKELQEAMEMKLRQVDENLQMPPVMAERVACQEVIVEDALLEQYDGWPHVFVDITYGVKSRDRYIVVRQVDGVLRTASWEERDKMNQVYFPQEGRHLDFPAIFQPDHLKEAMQRGFHQYLLDRNCVQFEPDDDHFIRVCHAVYDDINQNRLFDRLESTRHMGGLVFYLVSYKQPDNYIVYLLQQGRLDLVVDVLGLHYLLHPADAATFNSLVASKENEEEDAISGLKLFVSSLDRARQGNLELALQAYQEDARQANQHIGQRRAAS